MHTGCCRVSFNLHRAVFTVVSRDALEGMASKQQVLAGEAGTAPGDCSGVRSPRVRAAVAAHTLNQTA